MNMDPKKLNIILGVAVVVLLAVLGCLLVRKDIDSDFYSTKNLINGSAEPLVPANNPDTPERMLRTYTNTKYGFEFQYPKELQVFESEYGPTEYDKRGVSVQVGTPEVIAIYKNPPSGTEGPISHFSMEVHEPFRVRPRDEDCKNEAPPELKFTPITIGAIKTNKCTSNGMFGTFMNIAFTTDTYLYYHLASMQYEGDNKIVVDKILPTFRLLK